VDEINFFLTLYFNTFHMTGTVKFFISSKGYGFITNDETGEDLFVHATSLNGEDLNEGDKVEYVEEDGNKGKVAAQVQRI
jgi:CspA family cold shock protein